MHSKKNKTIFIGTTCQKGCWPLPYINQMQRAACPAFFSDENTSLLVNKHLRIITYFQIMQGLSLSTFPLHICFRLQRPLLQRSAGTQVPCLITSQLSNNHSLHLTITVPFTQLGLSIQFRLHFTFFLLCSSLSMWPYLSRPTVSPSSHVFLSVKDP